MEIWSILCTPMLKYCINGCHGNHAFLSRSPQGLRQLDSEFVFSKYMVQDFLLLIESWNGSPRTEGLLGLVVCLDVQK